MINFLNPVFLWSLLGISLPVLIHFFGKRSRKLIPFSYIKILKLTKKQTLKIEKIQEFFIILFRTILIFSILFVLSEPLSNSPIFKKEKKYVVFVIDNSMSMLANSGYGIEKTKKIIYKILNNFDKKTEISLIYLNGKFYNFQNDLSKIKDIIDKENLYYFSGNFRWALMKSEEILRNKEGEKFIFIFSDLQKKSFQDLDLNFKEEHIFIFDVSSENTENLSIKDVHSSNKKNCFTVDIKNWGNLKKDFYLSVKDNITKKIKEEKLSINPEENKKYEIEFNSESENIIFEINTEDAILADNIYFFTKTKKEKKLLLISEDEKALKFIINGLEALKSFLELNFNVVKMNDIEKIYLPEYQLIILNDTGRIKKEVIKSFNSYLKDTGNIILFIGDRTYPEIFNEIWEIKEEKIYLLPCKIEKTIISEKPLDINYIEKKEPVFYDFGEKIFEYINPVKFWKYYKIKENHGISLLKIEGNNDIMIKKNIGEGNIILFPFVLKNEWTNFQNKPFFPVFLSKIIENYAKDTNVNYIIGNQKKMNIPKDTEKIEIYKPDGELFKIVLKNENYEFNPDIPGFWKIKFYKEKEKKIAVNVDSSEGNLQKISYKEIKELFHGNLKIINDEKFEKFEKNVLKSRDLTDFFLSTAFIFLFLNVLFSEIMKFR